MNIRDQSDGGNTMSYQGLAQAYKRVINGLPRAPAGKFLWVQVHNEPDLCYEWWCGMAGSPMGYQQIAKEFTAFYIQTYDAIKSLGGAIKISWGALAPGGNRQCGCCGADGCPADQAGITGLDFMGAMYASNNQVWNKMDFLTSHSYPASNVGWGFNVPYDQAVTGLSYYKLELQKIGRNMPVLITETGWATSRADMPKCSEDQKGDWFVAAYNNVWLPDPLVIGVAPFLFRDGYWGDQLGYAYVRTDGTKLPIYNKVTQLRQSKGF
jgi:hypothetical protein